MNCRPPWDQPRAPLVPTPELDQAVRRHAAQFWLPAAVATVWLCATVAVVVWGVL